MKSIMKRRELNIGDIIQVGYNQVRVVRDEKVSCDGCYFRPICAKDYEALSSCYDEGGEVSPDSFDKHEQIASEWLSGNIHEEYAMAWEYEIVDLNED